MSAEIVDLPRGSLADIPALLRANADKIEAGEYGEVVRAVLVIEQGDLDPIICGMGDCSPAEGTYLLQRAIHWFCHFVTRRS